MKKSRFLIFAIIALLLLATGCGNASSEKSDTPAAAAQDSDTGTFPGNTQDKDNADDSTAEQSAEQDQTQFLQEAARFRKEHAAIEEADNYTVYEIPLERDGLFIYGRLYLPEVGDSNYPLVIVGHGLQSSYADCITDAEYFADAGIAAYIFDFCGGSYYSESDGDFLDMSVLTEEEDMEAVLDSLSEYPFFEKEQIFLMGESQGGLVAALLAAKRAEDIAGLILYYPAFGIPDNSRSWFGEAEMIPEDPAEYGAPLGYRYYYDTINMDAFAETTTYPNDVLIVHGDADEVVPLFYSETAVSEYSNATLHIIPGGGHGFSGEHLAEACSEAVTFVKSHLEPDRD